MVGAVGHKRRWHCSWWPSGHPEVLFPEGGLGLSQTIPVVKPRMCSSPGGLVNGVSVLCVSSGFEGSQEEPCHTGLLPPQHPGSATHLLLEPVPQAGAASGFIPEFQSPQAPVDLWGSGTRLPPWGEAENSLVPPC